MDLRRQRNDDVDMKEATPARTASMKNIPAFAAIFPCMYIGTHHVKGAFAEFILTLGLHQWHMGRNTLIVVACGIGLALATRLVKA